MNWDSFNAPVDERHQAVADKLSALMETGYHGDARELLRDYAEEYPDKAEALRLSLVRRYGTGL